LRPNGEHAATCPNNPHFYDDPEMKTCPICGREFNEEDMDYSVCAICSDKNATYENALAFGETDKYEIEINDFLASIFTKKEIEEILLRELNENGNVFVKNARESMAFAYCRDAPSAFADWLKERKEKH